MAPSPAPRHSHTTVFAPSVLPVGMKELILFHACSVAHHIFTSVKPAPWFCRCFHAVNIILSLSFYTSIFKKFTGNAHYENWLVCPLKSCMLKSSSPEPVVNGLRMQLNVVMVSGAYTPQYSPSLSLLWSPCDPSSILSPPLRASYLPAVAAKPQHHRALVAEPAGATEQAGVLTH